MTNRIIFDNQRWMTVEDIMDIAYNNKPVAISDDSNYHQLIQAGVDFLDDTLVKDGVIYGVTTGYGDSCTRAVSIDLVPELPKHLVQFHGCGLGEFFTHQQSKAIAATRLTALSKGYSGVSLELIKQIAILLNHDIAALIPEEGSVGASGDLTPLSYLAAVLMGERQVTYQEKQQTTTDVFKALGITPITLRPKEGLAIMNGTAAMTAIACEAFQRTQYLSKFAARLTAMSCVALQGNPFHFDEQLFAVKPHPGQIRAAAWIFSDLDHKHPPANSARLQDRYSLRCAPHIIGVIEDSLSWFRQLIENELNSTNDNPVIDPHQKLVLHGGHFYGGHIATAMDTMKVQVANLADLVDRQMATLVDDKFNNGLPHNVSYSSQERAAINHGFKAVQIAVSAWTAEALKHTMPASVFSRSTECHNQDKVSMGTIAARDCLRILTLTEQVFAAHLLVTTQAIQIRIQQDGINTQSFSPEILNMMESILEDFDLVTEDRPLDQTLRQFTRHIREQKWELYHEHS